MVNNNNSNRTRLLLAHVWWRGWLPYPWYHVPCLLLNALLVLLVCAVIESLIAIVLSWNTHPAVNAYWYTALKCVEFFFLVLVLAVQSLYWLDAHVGEQYKWFGINHYQRQKQRRRRNRLRRRQQRQEQQQQQQHQDPEINQDEQGVHLGITTPTNNHNNSSFLWCINVDCPMPEVLYELLTLVVLGLTLWCVVWWSGLFWSWTHWPFPLESDNESVVTPIPPLMQTLVQTMGILLVVYDLVFCFMCTGLWGLTRPLPCNDDDDDDDDNDNDDIDVDDEEGDNDPMQGPEEYENATLQEPLLGGGGAAAAPSGVE